MKSAIILVIIYASIAVAQVSVGLLYVGQHTHNGVSFQRFGISVFNGASGNGLINSITDVRFFTVPDLLQPYLIYNFNGSAQQYSGNIYTVCAQAAGWGEFSVPSADVDSDPAHYITISVVYNLNNGQEGVAGAVFALSSSFIAKKDVESDSMALEGRGTAPTILPTGDWQEVYDSPTWESLRITAGTSELYNVVWTVVDPTLEVAITYPTSGNSYSTIAANAYKTTSVKLEADYNNDVPYALNISITYYLSSGGPQYLASWTKDLDVTLSKKRSADRTQIAAVQSSSLRTEYAIGIASAGVAVAAVAVVAAVVIVRRKKATVSDL